MLQNIFFQAQILPAKPAIYMEASLYTQAENRHILSL